MINNYEDWISDFCIITGEPRVNLPPLRARRETVRIHSRQARDFSIKLFAVIHRVIHTLKRRIEPRIAQSGAAATEVLNRG